jgi:hypothetical protein
MEMPEKTPGKARGQAMVEFTLHLPQLLVISIGILEFGMLFKDHMGVHYATREGARIGVAASRLPEADCLILNAISTTLQTMPFDGLQLVRIYRANGPDGECEPYSPGGGCPQMFYNRSTSEQPLCNANGLNMHVGWYEDILIANPVPWRADGTAPNPWRDNIEAGGVDSLGVEVQFSHRFFFNFVPGADTTTVIIVDHTVMQIEPDRFRPVPTPVP